MVNEGVLSSIHQKSYAVKIVHSVVYSTSKSSEERRIVAI